RPGHGSSRRQVDLQTGGRNPLVELKVHFGRAFRGGSPKGEEREQQGNHCGPESSFHDRSPVICKRAKSNTQDKTSPSPKPFTAPPQASMHAECRFPWGWPHCPPGGMR